TRLVSDWSSDVCSSDLGTWLLMTVATQAVSVLGTLLADHFPKYREALLFITLCMFLLGCMLYLMLITLIFYRFTFVKLTTITLRSEERRVGKDCRVRWW